MNNYFKNRYSELKLPLNIKNKVENIRLDNTRGSIDLANEAAEVFIFLIDNYNLDSSLKLCNLINKTAYELIRSQPAMASIFNLGNTLTLNILKLKDIGEIKDTVKQICEKFINNLNLAIEKICERTLEVLKDNITIITHSYSSTLLNTFIHAKNSGKNIKIICTESRPMNEGVKVATLLGQNGIKVKLVVDSCVYSFLSEADLILVGADSISYNGVINKIGTCGLALAAKNYNKKIYSVCSFDKFLPKEYPICYKHLKDPKEIISKSIENVEPVNYYFDLTSLELISGFITEKGILSSLEIQEIIDKMPINKNLIK
jgi:translation initiation factor 2B subunit (eIF-2B alpha/beta/delta family)